MPRWNYPTTIHFDCHAIDQLPELVKTLKLKNPLLVTDPILAEFEMVKKIQHAMHINDMQMGLFCNIQPNPTGTNIEEGVTAYNVGEHDGIIALGGGSAMDAGKVIALMAKQTCHWTDLEDHGDNYLRANAELIPPIIAIPTTSGTGSEVGRAALIIHEDKETQKHSKKIIFHPKLLPSWVICDPYLTINVPSKLTAATGMDALAHNLEALCAPGYHPMADGIALEGIRLIHKWLPIAVHDGSNIEARTHLMAAALMGATAFQKGLGAIHSLSHPIGAIYRCHHGLLNAIFMPYVLEYNSAYIEAKMQRLSTYLELDSTSPKNNSSTDTILQWVKQLNKTLSIPRSLSEIDVNPDDLTMDEIVRQALLDGSTPSNPRPMDSESVKKLLIQAVYNGDRAS